MLATFLFIDFGESELQPVDTSMELLPHFKRLGAFGWEGEAGGGWGRDDRQWGLQGYYGQAVLDKNGGWLKGKHYSVKWNDIKIFIQLLLFSDILIMEFSLKHLQDVSRRKKSRNWLEPKHGVGITSERSSVRINTVNNWCLLCGTEDNLAVCLGSSCMGKQAVSKLTDFGTSADRHGSFSQSRYQPQRINKVGKTILKSRDFTGDARRKIAANKFPCFFPNNKAVLKVRVVWPKTILMYSSLPDQFCGVLLLLEERHELPRCCDSGVRRWTEHADPKDDPLHW